MPRRPRGSALSSARGPASARINAPEEAEGGSRPLLNESRWEQEVIHSVTPTLRMMSTASSSYTWPFISIAGELATHEHSVG